MSETWSGETESLISPSSYRGGDEAAATTCHDSCKSLSDKRGSATIASPSGPVSELWCGS